jgi:hypothetical protein
MKLTGEDRNTREKLSQCHFVHHKAHVYDPGSKSGLLARKPAAKRLSHGTTLNHRLHQREHYLRIFFAILYFVVNHSNTEIMLNYILEAYFVPRGKHTASQF